MSFLLADHLPHLGVCETWIYTQRNDIYFKLKIKDRPPSIYLATVSALTEFGIWEEKKMGTDESLRLSQWACL